MKMKNADISSFLNIEENFNLYYDKIENVNYWIYSRWFIWNMIRAQLMNIEVPEKKPSIPLNKMFITASTLLKNCLFSGCVRRKNIDILFLAHERRILDGKFYKCMYTEKLTDIFPEHLVLEHPYIYKHFRPVKTKRLVYTDRIAVNGELKYRFIKKILTHRYEELVRIIKKKIEIPVSKLAQLYGVFLNLDEITGIIAEKIIFVRVKRKYFQRILNKCRPKVIVQVVNYAMDCMVVNELAKTMHIRTIELQHGQISAWHIAYNYCGKQKIDQLPDKILLFSEYWKENINISSGQTELMVTGFPYFEEQRVKYFNKSKRKQTIIFISQMEIGLQLSKIASSLYDLMENYSYQIIYKLHPNEYSSWKDNYPWLLKRNIRVVDNKQNLYELFGESEIQVGVCSTGLYEGLGFELQTYILDLPLSDEMKKLKSAGYVEFFSTANELLELISKPRINHKNDFWKEDSLNNMVRVITDEVQRKEG